jgi:hypothetical protein
MKSAVAYFDLNFQFPRAYSDAASSFAWIRVTAAIDPTDWLQSASISSSVKVTLPLGRLSWRPLSSQSLPIIIGRFVVKRQTILLAETRPKAIKLVDKVRRGERRSTIVCSSGFSPKLLDASLQLPIEPFLIAVKRQDIETLAAVPSRPLKPWVGAVSCSARADRLFRPVAPLAAITAVRAGPAGRHPDAP